MEPNATVAVGPLKWDCAVFEKLHERWTAYAEEVSSLLGGEKQTLRSEEDCLALAHHVDNLAKDAVDLGGERYLLAVRSKEQAGFRVTLNEACQVEQLVQILRREDDVLPTSL